MEATVFQLDWIEGDDFVPLYAEYQLDHLPRVGDAVDVHGRVRFTVKVVEWRLFGPHESVNVMIHLGTVADSLATREDLHKVGFRTWDEIQLAIAREPSSNGEARRNPAPKPKTNRGRPAIWRGQLEAFVESGEARRPVVAPAGYSPSRVFNGLKGCLDADRRQGGVLADSVRIVKGTTPEGQRALYLERTDRSG